MITRTNPSEAALVSTLEAILNSIRPLQAPHNLFTSQSKRMRRHADNIEDAVLETLAYLTDLGPGAEWSKATMDALSPILAPISADLSALHDAIHEQNELVWKSWGPVTPEVAAYMAVEALVSLYKSLKYLAHAQVYRHRVLNGITEEESKAAVSQDAHPRIEIIGGDVSSLPPHIRKMLGGLLGGQE